MTTRSPDPSRHRRVPMLWRLIDEWREWREARHIDAVTLAQPRGTEVSLAYPLDFAQPTQPRTHSATPGDDEDTVAADHLRALAERALASWNVYATTHARADHDAFLGLAHLFMDRASLVTQDPPAPSAVHYDHAVPVAVTARSASVLGMTLSVLVRAHMLTGERPYLDAARALVATLAADILDGGQSALVGEAGIFFEEVAAYPAAHPLAGHALAILGLDDVVEITGDPATTELIARAHETLHDLYPLYEAGFWTYDDATTRHLSSPATHALHGALIAALARTHDCVACGAMAARWRRSSRSAWCRARAFVTKALARAATTPSSPGAKERDHTHVCVPITAFPVPGGMRSVLAAVSRAMAEDWDIEYLTRYIGSNPEHLAIIGFAGFPPTLRTDPFMWPSVWRYVRAGQRQLEWLFRHDHRYGIILPQDGLFSGAFASAIGKRFGARVVCMDHGTLTLTIDSTYRAERLAAVGRRPWPIRPVTRLRLALYWRAVDRMARASARNVDQFLVAGDEVSAVLRERLDVHPSKILRYPYAVDAARFRPPDAEARARLRAEIGLDRDAIVVTMINRLAPEKGLDTALAAMSNALAAAPPDVRDRARMLIAGDGPLRAQLESEVQRLGLGNVVRLWGDAAPHDVPKLLGASDIFLYTGLRGTNFSVAVLEAMAAGCAVVGSTQPRSNISLLADERGIAVAPGDALATGQALTRLMTDPSMCHALGLAAARYVERHHSHEALRRALLRATYGTATHSALARHATSVASLAASGAEAGE